MAIPCGSIAASPSNLVTNPRDERLRLQIVSIETGSTQGSGVIIKRSGNTYTILTAAHVVNAVGSSPVNIVTPDRQQYSTNPNRLKLAPNAIDLATITFESDREYSGKDVRRGCSVYHVAWR